MKNKILLLYMMLSLNVLSQSSKAGFGGNTRILATDFLGWGGGFPGTLNIRNDFAASASADLQSVLNSFTHFFFGCCFLNFPLRQASMNCAQARGLSRLMVGYCPPE